MTTLRAELGRTFGIDEAAPLLRAHLAEQLSPYR